MLRTCTIIIFFLDAPPSPQNTNIITKIFYANISSFTIQWGPGIGLIDNHYIEYYHIEMIMLNTTVESFNTTSTNASFTGVPYNENLTILITANNCIGFSPPETVTVRIGNNNY